MTTTIQRALLSVAALLIVLFVIGMAFGLRLNFTDSAPSGLWRVRSHDAVELTRGQLVAICPPTTDATAALVAIGVLPAGSCAGGSAPLLKPIVAVAGDQVTVSADGITVNGDAILGSKPLNARLPAPEPGEAPVTLAPYGGAKASNGVTHRVTVDVLPGQVWVVSSYSAKSYDSRYFGPLNVSAIEGIAMPLVTRGDLAGVYRKATP